jgi:hypothetical protein
MKLKFKKGIWRNVAQQLPFHHGAYDVRLRSGEEGRIEFSAGTWVNASNEIIEWRGLELLGISRTNSARQAIDAYRAALHPTHGLALEAALFLARRAVSLNFRPDAYHFYLVANALGRTRLMGVDKEWIERFASGARKDVAIEQMKADEFFKHRGGRPPLESENRR